MTDKPEKSDLFPNETIMEEYVYSDPIHHMAWNPWGQMRVLYNDAETLLAKAMRKSILEGQMKAEDTEGHQSPKVRGEDFHLQFQG